MPHRPGSVTSPEVLAHASVQDPTHYHDPRSEPTAPDSRPQIYYEQPPPDSLDQVLANETQTAAATLVSLYQPLPPHEASSSSQPLPPAPYAHPMSNLLPGEAYGEAAEHDYSSEDDSQSMLVNEGSTDSQPWTVPSLAELVHQVGHANDNPTWPLWHQAMAHFADTPFTNNPVIYVDPPVHVDVHIGGHEIEDHLPNALHEPLGPQDPMDEGDDTETPLPPVLQSNPHVGPLGPDNPGVLDFLTYWARLGNPPGRRTISSRVPSVLEVTKEAAKRPSTIRYADLVGDGMDFQGLEWQKMHITRASARERRHLIYRNYVNAPGSDTVNVSAASYLGVTDWRLTKTQESIPDRLVPNSESYFRFTRMDMRKNINLAHFQLRNLLGCAGQSHAFYPGKKAVYHMNPLTGQSELSMNLSDISHVQVSTLDADNDVVVAGTFTGEYCMKGAYANDKSYARGQITGNTSGITNHLQIHQARTSGTRVAFSSNDRGFRVMDVATEKFILETQYSFPMNCSAVSSDRRLRVMVGDSYEALIVNAESGEVIQELFGPRDYGFACAWSDDGWAVATAAQDRGIKIWDARRWTNSSGRSTPVTTIRSEMAAVRGLRFSPVGSGPRVLVAAEEADFVNIIDAQSFASKQTFDIFGEIGGVAFNNEGHTLNILCCDRNRGGLIQMDRCNYGPRLSHGEETSHGWSSFESPFDTGINVGPRFASRTTRAHPQMPTSKRRRLYLDDLQPF